MDVPVSDSRFGATQALVMAGGYGEGAGPLEFGPELVIGPEERARWTRRAAGRHAEDLFGAETVSRADYAVAMMGAGLV